jgi:glycosyltransferase involved in cell wall biosynthesis
MYLKKTISVVVPAYNEEKLIGETLRTIPSFVDKIIVVDDRSNDSTVTVVRAIGKKDKRVLLLEHAVNQGVGGAIITGYKQAVELKVDVTAVMAGDNQMDPNDLQHIVEPVARGVVDYTKGNRLFQGDAWNMIPHYRYLGNSLLSLFTKIASGYWHIADSQTGYTAVSIGVLRKINLDSIYKRYGMPNDMLIKLNQYDFRVRDIHVRPVYNIGEKSGIKLMKVIPKIFFYILSCILLCSSIPLSIRLFYLWVLMGDMPDMTALALIFTLISGLQTLFFGMWFDMEYNKDLK